MGALGVCEEVLSARDLAEYRRAVAEKRAVESGAVGLSLGEAAGIYERFDALSARIVREYGLDADERWSISPITGHIRAE